MKYVITTLLIFLISVLTPKPLQDSDSLISEDIQKEISIKEKVGQLFIFGLDEIPLTEESDTFLTENNMGGILLLGKNITKVLHNNL